jgi:Coenzyme PQQ synthesis protein D (PqqD)
MSLMRRQPGNFLDMIPVRNVGEFTHEGEKTTLHVPKFKSPWMLKWLIPPRRSKHFRIHLDEMGSKVWDLIDGVKDTKEICRRMKETMPSEPEKADALDLRITEFLRRLYKNRFIVFK